MGNAAWIFPGQGSQKVGMGRKAIERSQAAANVFSTADEALGFKLSQVILNGPEEALVSTRIQQPAILTASIAYFESLRETTDLPEPACVAGHSLGEYSALVAAGSLDLADAARLVHRRGELMEEHGLGGMIAVIGLDADQLVEIAEEAGVDVANFNAPGQTTLSGRTESLELAGDLAKERGARRVVPLPVNGAFHSTLMQPVAEALWPEIERVEMRPPSVPLLANVDARPLTDPDELRAELRDQITASVRWIDIVQTASSMAVTQFYEVGPGKVLSGLVPRIVKGAETITAEALLGDRTR
jgi:[acyl-carrier-protein] S-malonyltransferase